MMRAKVFEDGEFQAIELPEEFHFSEDEVFVNKIGDVVVLFPKSDSWDSFMLAIDMFSPGFMEDGRESQSPSV